MNNFSIRRAKLEDAKAIHEAHMKSIQQVCSKEHSPEEISVWGNRPYLEDKRQNTIKNDLVWVVENDGKIEGFGHLGIFEKDNRKHAHIFGLYLTPRVIGNNLGKSIIEFMLIEAKAARVKEITLKATLTAHKFYQKMGFEDIGPETTVEMSGQKIRCYPMKMRLEN